MFYSEIDRIANRILNNPLWEQMTETTTYVPSKFAVEVTEEKAVMALAVLGHDVNDIEINCYEVDLLFCFVEVTEILLGLKNLFWICLIF